jgi:hypothetical protein
MNLKQKVNCFFAYKGNDVVLMCKKGVNLLNYPQSIYK